MQPEIRQVLVSIVSVEEGDRQIQLVSSRETRDNTRLDIILHHAFQFLL